MSILPTHRPRQATVVFHKIGEPEIIMQETFPCQHEYPGDAWASAVARKVIGYEWLAEAIRIITVSYDYNVWEAPSTYEEKEEYDGSGGQEPDHPQTHSA